VRKSGGEEGGRKSTSHLCVLSASIPSSLRTAEEREGKKEPPSAGQRFLGTVRYCFPFLPHIPPNPEKELGGGGKGKGGRRERKHIAAIFSLNR